MTEEKKGTVFVVDDDDNIVKAMIRILKNEGFEVYAATDGRNALEMTARRKFDLMFLDIMMPGFSGLDVMALMQAARPEMPIVIISALNDAATKNEALNLGAYDYLTKPFGPKQIVEVANRILGSEEEKSESTETPESEA
ncbi:MAG: response regulator [Dehalococcoidia bacterium]